MNAFVIQKPVITEKTLQLAKGLNMFTFQVSRTASKQQVADAIRRLYNVDVTSVNTIFGHPDTKATGRRRIKRVQAKVKKAIVTLKQGQTIDVFDIGGNA